MLSINRNDGDPTLVYQEHESRILCQRFKMKDGYACHGDSGGPIVVEKKGTFVLVAVASTVPGMPQMYSWPPACKCSCEIVPETHARVSSVLPWIYQNMEQRKLKLPCQRQLWIKCLFNLVFVQLCLNVLCVVHIVLLLIFRNGEGLIIKPQLFLNSFMTLSLTYHLDLACGWLFKIHCTWGRQVGGWYWSLDLPWRKKSAMHCAQKINSQQPKTLTDNFLSSPTLQYLSSWDLWTNITFLMHEI